MAGSLLLAKEELKTSEKLLDDILGPSEKAAGNTGSTLIINNHDRYGD